MPGPAVIIIPSQGSDTNAFEDVANSLKKNVYGNKATIVKTIADATSATFVKLDGKPFTFAEVTGLATVLTISHGGGCDGPNLAYHSGGHQPWGTGGSSGLTKEAKDHWESVGKALGSSGKIILMGCYMGGGGGCDGDYARSVAAASKKAVYAADGLIGAGDEAVARKYIKGIEQNKVLAPMKKFDPPAPKAKKP